ncbi:tol-pal system protein YbgF [Rhizobium sp. BK251]|uniref:tol-pal system protein YbgF n=1 Tax=Rhizobium sp. BK251 TaxID=2512125 RepID=UPI0010468062|nr:tol-pal system protein YbgF [Rhizobium sp. BK251]TCL69818.1 tol-pal system protein YbgF [Rhizobium sp. BK251]
MKKFVVAGLLCLAAVAGTERAAYSMSIFGLHLGDKAAESRTPDQPVVRVQSSDSEVRLQQLEEQMRQLNGRIEEMSFQLLQMQEQIRKAQEDNEFRFQQLEKGGTKKSGSLEKPVGGQSDDVAKIIEAPQGAETAPSTSVPDNTGLGQPPSQLGSLELDQNGQPIGTTRNSQSNASAPLPRGDAGAPQQTASLGSEGDIYKAAYGHVLSGDYGLAEEEFGQFISRYPNSARAADANFWLGEALYSQGKYNEAAKTFLNAHQKYASSEKAPEMLLKLGMSLAALDNKDTACATLREVPKRYPKASRAVVTKVASEQKRLAC